MNYEEKYKNALERARELSKTVTGANYEYIFPELQESEGERIRKAIKKALQVRCDGSRIISDEPVTLEEAIAWLEKQGKKQPADELMNVRQELYQSEYNDGYKHGYNHGQNNIAIALGKEPIDALEHFVRSIGETMKIKTGKLRECLAFLPTLNLNWIETSKGMIFYLQLSWAFWYIEITINKFIPTGCRCHKHRPLQKMQQSRKEASMIPRNEFCKHYRSWVCTSKGEINCACVDEEKRTITKCDYTESNGCWKCPKKPMKGGEE